LSVRTGFPVLTDFLAKTQARLTAAMYDFTSAEIMNGVIAAIRPGGGLSYRMVLDHRNILKRLLIHVAAFNLSLILRREAGVGTPQGLQDRRNRLFCYFWALWMLLQGLWERYACQPATSAGRFRFYPCRTKL
jgi:hypothetical protein